jgi:hypothetical protein
MWCRPCGRRTIHPSGSRPLTSRLLATRLPLAPVVPQKTVGALPCPSGDRSHMPWLPGGPEAPRATGSHPRRTETRGEPLANARHRRARTEWGPGDGEPARLRLGERQGCRGKTGANAAAKGRMQTMDSEHCRAESSSEPSSIRSGTGCLIMPGLRGLTICAMSRSGRMRHLICQRGWIVGARCSPAWVPLVRRCCILRIWCRCRAN